MDPGQGDTSTGAASTTGEVMITDAVVIGAGPVGLFQVFELGLQEIRAHVVDALPFIGGQPAQLYPDKPIYDIPGLPACTGQELADALARQCAPFKPVFHLGETVTGVARQTDGRLLLETSAGTRLLARTVFIAGGVGAFEPRRLKVDGLDRFEGSQVFHHIMQVGALAGQQVIVVGDDEQAVGFALDLVERKSNRPRSVTLMHRRSSLRIGSALEERLQTRCGQHAMQFVVGQACGLESDAGRLTSIHIALPNGTQQQLPVDTLLVLQGLSPRLGPIAQWGLAMENKLLKVDTERFSTSEPGIFAVGDISTYPGKRKLLVCGFHECALAAFAAAPIVHPKRPVQLEYTTSSTHLHQLLGVATSASR